MPAEWDTYLERMGVEEANASNAHKTLAYHNQTRQINPYSA